MEQATAGKAPPPIAINSAGGGIQILNMNAVRAGATVVPSNVPGSAQTATVVGSPGGPPGKVGPRMISITPQMIANANRPGQPAADRVDGSDFQSVKLCNNLKLNPTAIMAEQKQSYCSASNTGVFSGLMACDDDDECEEGEIRDDDDDYNDEPRNNTRIDIDTGINSVKASDNHVEGNNSTAITGDTCDNNDNDLAPSCDLDLANAEDEGVVEDDDEPGESGSHSIQVSKERSESLEPNSPSSSPSRLPSSADSNPLSQSQSPHDHDQGVMFDENKNHDSINSGSNRLEKGIIKVEESNSENQVENSQQDIHENSRVGSLNESYQSEEEEATDVPTDAVSGVDSSRTANHSEGESEEKETRYSLSPSPPGCDPQEFATKCASASLDADESSSQNCVQNEEESSICASIEEPVDNNCDKRSDSDSTRNIVIVQPVGAISDANANSNDEISKPVISPEPKNGKCLDSHEPLVESPPSPAAIEEDGDRNEDVCMDLEGNENPTEAEPGNESYSGNQGSLEGFINSGNLSGNDDHSESDKVLLSLESPSSSHAEKGANEDNSNRGKSSLNDEELFEENLGNKSIPDPDQNKPKLMDVNLADFMFMDCDDEMEDGGRPWLSSESQQMNLSTKTSESSDISSYVENVVQSGSGSGIVRRASSEKLPPVSTPASLSLSYDGSWNSRGMQSFSSQQDGQVSKTAFQMFTVGQQQSQQVRAHSQPEVAVAVAARIPMRSDLYAKQSHSTSNPNPLGSFNPTTPARHSQSHFNLAYGNNTSSNISGGSVATSGSGDRSADSFGAFMRANNSISASASNPNVQNAEYKMNSHSSQNLQKSCFTNDPQLHSQFVQYTQNYPLQQQQLGARDAGKGPLTSPLQSAPATTGVRQQQLQPHRNHHDAFGRSQSQVATSMPQQQQSVIGRLPTGRQSQQHLASPQQPHPQSQHGHIRLQIQNQQRPLQPQPQPQYRQTSHYNPNSLDSSNKSTYLSGATGAGAYQSQIQGRSIPNPNYATASNHNPPTSSSSSVPMVGPGTRQVIIGNRPYYNLSMNVSQPPISSMGLSSAQQQQHSVNRNSHPPHQPQMHSAPKLFSSCSFDTASQPGVRFQQGSTSGTGFTNSSQQQQQTMYQHSSNYGSGLVSSTPRSQLGANTNTLYPGGVGTYRIAGVGIANPNPVKLNPSSCRLQGQQQQVIQMRPPVPLPYHHNQHQGKEWSSSIPTSIRSAISVPSSSSSAGTIRSSTHPYAHTNSNHYGGAGGNVHRPIQQHAFSRLPLSASSSTASMTGSHQPQPHQSQYRPGSYHPSAMPNSVQPSGSSVIASRFPTFAKPTSVSVQDSQFNYSGSGSANSLGSGANANTSSLQVLKHSQYIAHLKNSSVSVPVDPHHHPSVIVGNNSSSSSVIRPNIYSGGSMIPTTCSSVLSASSSISSNSSRNIYPGISYSGAGGSQNQASVIRSNSSLVDRVGYNNLNAGSGSSGYNFQSGSSGDLTLQSFLSNPNAPFMCPSSSSSSSTPGSSPNAERSATTRSGYYNNESWETPCVSRGDQGLLDQEQSYPYSSCQYSDAMRRNNAPITLQALSGLPPGANHLLVKTENRQFQLVSVRMQSPTAAAAAPGTPVVPSTVAAPPTSMSIAQQLPSSSPLAPPPLPPHSASSGPPLVPPISSSILTTTTIPPPPHPSQQGRFITSSSSNHIVTSWSSSNNNSLVNNNFTTSSPLPSMISSSAVPPPPPHIMPPPSSHHPSPIPSSVIMPPNLSASNSQLLISTANNIISSTSSSSSTYSTAAQAAVAAAATAYTQRTSHPHPVVVSGSLPGGNVPPPPPHHHNSIPSVLAPAAGTMNNLPPGSSVIRSGGLGTNNLPPPPPPVKVTGNSSSVAASSVTSSSNLLAAPPTTGPGSFRPQSAAASQVPNNNASNNAQGGMGLMMPGSGSNSNTMSVHPHHQIHPQYSPLHLNTSVLSPPPHVQQHAPPLYPSSKIVSSNATANTVSQMSNETAKNKCKNFLSFLLELSAKQNQTVARNVKNLIQGLIDGKVNEENFADRLQKEVNSQPQPCLVGFLKKSLPHLRHSLATGELKIEGIKPPPLSTFVPPAPVSALAPQAPPPPSERKQTPPVRPTTPTVPPAPMRIMTTPVNSASPSAPPSSASTSNASAHPPTTSPSPSSTKSSKSKGGSSKSKSNSAKAAAAAAAAAAALSDLSSSGSGASLSSSGPGGTPSTKSSIPSSKSGKEKEKKDKTFSSSGYSADDDINDVAAMGGVNLAEESQRILGSTEYVGTQIRSCRDETMLQPSPIISKFRSTAAKFGLDELPSQDISTLLSHAVEERLKTMIEKLSVIAEHRMDVIKLDDRYEITQDVKGQLKFLEELDKIEKKRHDEQEREMLIRAAKSRSKSEDPEQAKLKAKAKEMQRVALEEMRQRDANVTALQAIGPRKKPKLDIAVGSHGSMMPSPLGATGGASSSLGRPQILRPRLKRVNLRDLLFLLEHDKETMRSPFLYKNLLLK